MMKYILALCAAAMLLAVSTAGARAAESYRMRIVLLGDSVISGQKLLAEEKFGHRLQRRLQGIGFDVEVLDLSAPNVSAMNAGGRVMDVVNANPDLIVVALGLDDILRGIDPTLIYNNLYKLLYQLVKNEKGRDRGVYIVLGGMKAPSSMGYDYRARIEANYAALAAKLALSFHPFLLQGVAGVPENSMADGVRPNAAGVNAMVENLVPLIDPLLRHRLQYLARHNAVMQQRHGTPGGY